VAGDLGGLTLTPGVYKSGSSLGLTGQLTLDAEGNPAAVFIFQAGSTLTTASASDVSLINGAQPCNVFWQIGSSATLGTTSVFAGDILAHASIAVNNGVTVQGGLFARSGAVTLINDTITQSACTTAASTTPAGSTPGGSSPGGSSPGGSASKSNGAAILTTVPRSVATAINLYGTGRCVQRVFRVAVTGLYIRRVVFTLGGKVVDSSSTSPFDATISAVGGVRNVAARVTFTDSTPAETLKLRYRACAAALIKTLPPIKPVVGAGFTG